jgi:uncharacterized protein YndB with AHSA1/START domain
MKCIALALIVVAVMAAAVAFAGWRLPQSHEASRQATFNAPPDAVWTAITDVEAFPSWRTDVKTVQRLPDRDGRKVWVEQGRSGRITMAVDRAEPPRLLVLRIADPDLPFGGTWTYEIAAAPGGSTLRITERGEIYNPIFRFMARFVFGYEATMAAYLQALDARLRAGMRS